MVSFTLWNASYLPVDTIFHRVEFKLLKKYKLIIEIIVELMLKITDLLAFVYDET